MRRFVIEVYTDKPSVEDREGILISFENYLNYIQAAKSVNVLDNLLKFLTLGCANCKGFSVDTKIFLAVNEKMQEFLFYLKQDEYPENWHELEDVCSDIAQGLKEFIYLSDEDWERYTVEGFKDKNIMEDEDGNFYRFASDEVAFIFDKKCNCYKVLVGE